MGARAEGRAMTRRRQDDRDQGDDEGRPVLRWLRLARDTASGLVLMYELVDHLYTVAGWLVG
ncbi:hypothetical protein C3460_24320 [Serratia marcescens]|nr:hypothetical protein C3459_24225 [Serratia marcescens]POW93814.1 hypothetical protein C3462_24305 [Serratia marcescens]POX08001.1 hypothetical protein C3725_24225 [Serratia marcescens]POX10085.1 hypothetical protein C3460_24320 [Serratia marcescens]POX17464.1 hypothetical protein C3468_25650 [Serratia marcescens]